MLPSSDKLTYITRKGPVAPFFFSCSRVIYVMIDTMETTNQSEVMSILEKKDVMKSYSFSYEDDGYSKIICKCGETFEKEIENEQFTDQEVEVLSDMKDILLFSIHEKLKCPHCGTNYFLEDQRARLIPIGSEFMGGFKFTGGEDSARISFWKLSSLMDNDTKQLYFHKEDKYISVSKDDITFVDYDGSRQDMDLNNMVNMTSNFLNTYPLRTVYDMHELHLFLMWLSRVTRDANKMLIVEEFIAPIRNKMNNGGLDYMLRALSSFFCIIKYPSLSTIALTKNVTFLSDLIMACDMPSSYEMKQIGNTSPLDIFNGLTGSYLKRMKNEISHDNNSVKEYVFKPSELTPDLDADGKIILTDKSSAIVKDLEIPQEQPRVAELITGEKVLIDSAFSTGNTASEKSSLKIKVRDQKKMDRVSHSRISDSGRGERGGRSSIIAAVEDGTITKYIYDHLRTFSDYQLLVKYFKFYNKHELSDLMKKYEMDYLINFINIGYWREKTSNEEFYRLYKIIKDFVRHETIGKRLFNENKNIDEIDDKDLDYSTMERFDFTIYDDSISMLESIRDLTASGDGEAVGDSDMFDRSRYFDKIREYKKLKNFHDSLAAQYRLLTVNGAEQNSSYHKFVSKYDWLESKEGYDGPIEVQLLRTMSDFMKEGHIMMSSQAQYGAQVSRGIYLVARLLDKTVGGDPKEARRFTIGFTVDRFGFLEFDQLKEYKNAQASDRVKAEVRKWLKAKDITYDERTTDIRFRNS